MKRKRWNHMRRARTKLKDERKSDQWSLHREWMKRLMFKYLQMIIEAKMRLKLSWCQSLINRLKKKKKIKWWACIEQESDNQFNQIDRDRLRYIQYWLKMTQSWRQSLKLMSMKLMKRTKMIDSQWRHRLLRQHHLLRKQIIWKKQHWHQWCQWHLSICVWSRIYLVSMIDQCTCQWLIWHNDSWLKLMNEKENIWLLCLLMKKERVKEQ